MKKISTSLSFNSINSSISNNTASVNFGKLFRIAGLLLLLLGGINNNASAFVTNYYYPTSATASANAAYCTGATPAPLACSIATATGIAFGYAPTTVSWTWYYNTTGATGTLAGATPVYTGATYTAGAGAYSAPLPAANISTATAGTFYYFVYVQYSGYYASGDLYSNLVTITVHNAAVTITGPGSVCPGSTINLTDATGGGTWSSSTTTVATVVSTSGVVTGVTSGTTTITYAELGGCDVTTVVTVDPLSTISGVLSLCQGGTTSLSDAGGGGTWTSSNTGIATAGLTTGNISGVSPGTSTIVYTSSLGCSISAIVTVDPLPSGILGNPTVCQGLSTTISDLTGSGTWGISNANGNIGSTTGLLTGVNGGTATVSYTLGTGCYVTTTATINPTPGAINGVTNICQGLSSSLTDGLGGGSWLSSNTSIATIGSSSGTLTGVAGGTCTVTYTLPTGCLITTTVNVNPAPTAILGTLSACAGFTSSLSDVVTGGVWSASNTNVSINAVSGLVNAITAGTATISYTTPTCTSVLAIFTVNPVPAAITTGLTVCNGLTTTLTDGVTGGTWLSGNIGVASIGSSSGFVQGFSVGTVNITYTLPAGCNTISVLTVNPSPQAISGPDYVCLGLTTTLSDPTGSGLWSSSNTNVSIGSINGVVTGNTAGTSTIIYTLPAGCTATTTFTTNPLPAAISGLASGCAGLVINLSDATAGGTWSSSNTSIATVGVSSGIVNGNLPGTATITYALPTTCISTIVVTVNVSPLAIVGPDNICIGSTTTLGDPAIGGTWASTTGAATIGSSSGLLTGMTAGTTTIIYTLPIGGCTSTSTVTVNPVPTPIVGQLVSCAGYFVPLSDASGSGTWSSSNPIVATIGSGSGLVYAATTGTTTIEYSFISTGCAASAIFTVNPSPVAIDGTPDICVGLTASFNDPTTGGTWSSSNANATVGSLSGVVEGVTPGTATIIYTLPTTCFITYPVTITPAPTPISGPSSVCHSYAITLTDGTHPGTWSVTPVSGTAGITGSGVLTGMSSGVVIVSYTTLACNPATLAVLVNPLPDPISGIGNLCQGSGTSLSDATLGGTWSSSNTSATVSSTGVVSGVDTGSGTNITYTLPTGCYVDVPVVVFPIPTPIMGADSVCPGSYVILSDTTAGGVWSSSNGAVATSIALTGKVEGATPGTVNISYTLVSGCYITKPFKVENPLPASLTITQTPDTLLCANTPVTLRAMPVNGGSATFVWELFGSEYMGDADTLRYNPTHGDYITCIMTTDSICSSPAVVETSLVMNIYPLVSPIVAVTTMQVDTATYLGEVFTFYTNVTYGGLTPTYQWYVNSVAIAGATNTSFTTPVYESNDSVYCLVTGNSPCDTATFAGSSNKVVIYGMDYLSVSTLSTAGNDLSLFPNPNTGSFTLSGTLSTTGNNDVTLEITDITGHTVYTGTTTPQNGAIHAEIKLDNGIAAGTYLLRVYTETGIETFHFVIGK